MQGSLALVLLLEVLVVLRCSLLRKSHTHTLACMGSYLAHIRLHARGLLRDHHLHQTGRVWKAGLEFNSHVGPQHLGQCLARSRVRRHVSME